MSSQRNKKTDEYNTRDKMRAPGKYISGKNWLDHSRACAKIDQMLLTGANMDQLLTSGRKRSAISSHLYHLKSDHGLMISNIDGVYTFDYDRTSKPTTEIKKSVDKTKAQINRDVPENPAITTASTSYKTSGVIKALFDKAQDIIREECERNPSDDLHRQFDIIRTRRYAPITDESDILNNLVIQASSYSVVRKYFGALYPEEIGKFDSHYGTKFFQVDTVPQYTYTDWERIVLAWGNTLLAEEGASQVSDLTGLVDSIRRVNAGNWASYSRQPRSRIILSLATALPKVKTEILSDTKQFFRYHTEISERHPGLAYNLATQFAKSIIGMGNPLVCNFFKELGLLHYVKIDVHVSGLVGDISVGQDLNSKEQFILSWLLARDANMEPFFVDKILYVGGKYCKPKLSSLFEIRHTSYMGDVSQLIKEIPAFA